MIQALVKPARQLLVIGGGFTGLRLAQAARRSGMAVRLTSRQPRSSGDEAAAHARAEHCVV